MGPAKKTIEKRKKYEIGYLGDEFTEESKIYAHTNEKMSSLLGKLHRVESALTVGSSGDQLLNLVAKGIYKVDTFDINTLTNYYINLRLAAIENIEDVQELWYFLFDMHKKGYLETEEALDPESYQFWHYLFNRYAYIEDIKVKLFRGDVDELDVMDNNYYLNTGLLIQMKKELKHLQRNNYNTHLFNLHSFIQGKKYDAIFLSNIYDYVDTVKFLRYLRILRVHLTRKGVIYYSYQYDAIGDNSVVDLLMRKDYKDEIPKERYYDEFGDIIKDTEIITLENEYDRKIYTTKDAVLALHK